ncbi:MAG: hypothetical protein EKK61_02675 [Rickettsiales bacterium]|nr:MAG: hypothetical protein EKK61_02675 [Rickettsiales bacterium]
MNNKNISTLELIVNLFNNLFHKKNLIILVGRNGLNLVALNSNLILDSIYIKYADEKYYQKYRKFLSNFKTFHVLFLLDNKDHVLNHEMLPVLSSIMKNNPIDKFISENYDSEDIVAYNTYEITNQNGEVWNTIIASTPFLPAISEILEYLIKKSFKYSGMYFLCLEFETIINRILHLTHHIDCLDHLQIFTTITKSSDIRVIVKYKKNIMSDQVVEYPVDKSDMYIQGTFEQAISDKLLYYKEYIKKLDLKVCLIFLVNKELKTLTDHIQLDYDTLISVSPEDININLNQDTGHFQDLALVKIFNNFNSYLALNKPLKSITKLTLINNMLFKPVIAFIFVLIGIMAFLKYQDLHVQSATNELNDKYYKLAQKYREVQKKHPDLLNISDLVDLYNLDRIINIEPNTPHDQIKSLIYIHNKNLKINKLHWRIIEPYLINFPQSKFEVAITLTYKNNIGTLQDGLEAIKQYDLYLKNIFPNYSVSYKINKNEIREVAKHIIIPAYFIIEGKVGEKTNAR